MSTDRELLAEALRAIELWSKINAKDLVVTQKIRARLAEPEDEPVRWLSSSGRVYRDKMTALMNDNFNELIPLYRHPLRPTGLDQLLELIRFLEQQIAERKNQ